jgi:hypothetical protein
MQVDVITPIFASAETTGTATPLVDFGEAIRALKQGKRVTRVPYQDDGVFVFRQVPAVVPAEIVPKMSSLPASVKLWAAGRSLSYSNQLAVVNSDGEVYGFAPLPEDILAEDWVILD